MGKKDGGRERVRVKARIGVASLTHNFRKGSLQAPSGLDREPVDDSLESRKRVCIYLAWSSVHPEVKERLLLAVSIGPVAKRRP